MNKIIYLLFLLNFSQIFCKRVNYTVYSGKSYKNYTLYRAIPIDDEQLKYYKNLTWKYEANFWRPPSQINKPIDIMIGPKHKKNFIRDVIRNGLYITTALDNVQDAFNMQTIKSYIKRRTETFDWMHYFRLKDIYRWLRDLANLHPRKLKVRVLGKTHENREILSVMINHIPTSRRDYRSLPLQRVIVEGGIHAREWISPSFVTYFLREVLYAPYSDDDMFKRLSMLYEWHFVPVLNPDGYEHTHTSDRMWRKNRNGAGVDVNRNFGYAFGTKGISFTPSKETYCGSSAFSEKESQAMATLVNQHKNNLAFYIAFHSYGQYVIIPYADSTRHSENFAEMKLMALLAVKELRKHYGTLYEVGTAYDTVGYTTSGISGDWVKKTTHARVVCTFELRDTGEYGFALPPNRILPTCEETMSAVKYLLTPRKSNWKDTQAIDEMSRGLGKTISDILVIVCNVLLFIIVRLD